LKRLKAVRCADIFAQGYAGPATLAGTVISKKERTSGKGNRYAFVQLSDPSGVFEATVFSELLASNRELLEVGRSLLIRANVQIEGDSVRFTAQSIEPLDQVAERLTANLAVFIDSAEPLTAIRDILVDKAAGRGQVKLVSWLEGGTEVEIALPGHYAISPAVALQLRGIPGVRDVREV
jgi:DNA polymerase-3 subunit alpha